MTMAEREHGAAESAAEEFVNPADVKEIYGNAANMERNGAPSEVEAPIRYYFYPTWRSQLMPLLGYGILCYLAILGSMYVPQSIIKGKLFAIGDTTYFLHLPLLIFLPGFMLGKILIYIYDSKYIIDERGVEAQIGLVSMSLRQPRLRYEDIRGVEPNQTIWERILGIGSVLVGSAMTQDVEIVMEGVTDPRAIQLMIGSERDKRLQSLRLTGQAHGANSIIGD